MTREPDDSVDIFFGVASGQQRAALRRLEPEGVMISHATQNNRPLPGDHETFVDCGGYHHMMNGSGEYQTTAAEYLEDLREFDPEFWALRDFPCEPDLLDELGRSVMDQQARSPDAHIDLWNRVKDHRLGESAVAVLQGWTESDYLSHLDDLRDHGCLTDTVAIGSVCRRGYDEEIAEIALTIRNALPQGTRLHAFGVKGSVLRYCEVVEALDSVDSAAYDFQASRNLGGRADPPTYDWRDCARAYLNWRHNLLSKMGAESLSADRSTQSTLSMAADLG